MATSTQHRLSPVELRVLGCLMEKQRTTPDQYPLSLNSLRLACNQTSNREPVMTLEEDEVRDAVHSLSRSGWVRLGSGGGARGREYPPPFRGRAGCGSPRAQGRAPRSTASSSTSHSTSSLPSRLSSRCSSCGAPR